MWPHAQGRKWKQTPGEYSWPFQYCYVQWPVLSECPDMSSLGSLGSRSHWRVAVTHWSHCWLRLLGSSLLSAQNLFSVVVALAAFLELESHLKNLEGETNASLQKRTCGSCLEQSGNDIRLINGTSETCHCKLRHFLQPAYPLAQQYRLAELPLLCAKTAVETFLIRRSIQGH